MIVHVHVYYIVLIFCGVKDLTPETFLYCFVTFLLHFMNQMHSLIYIFFVYRLDIPNMKFQYQAQSCDFILFHSYHLDNIVLLLRYVVMCTCIN